MDVEHEFKSLLADVGVQLTDDEIESVDDYLRAAEFGVAYDILCHILRRHNVQLSQTQFDQLDALGREMDMDPNLWDVLKPG